MKAQEYFDKYFANAEDADTIVNASRGFLDELFGEFETICKQRRVKSDDATLGVVRELNDKWNAVANKLAKKWGGKQIMKRNVVWNRLVADTYPNDPRCARKPE